MALPKGKMNKINTTEASDKQPGGPRIPTGPDHMPTKPVSPQNSQSGKKKGPPMNVGGLPKCK